MFVVNDDMSIYLTRGDTAIFSVTADNNGKNYVFQPGDVVRIKVTEKKACENVMFQKDFPVTEEAEKVDILLTEEETKIGEVISKPTDYWYEIELNPYTNPQTIVGYDEDGAKILRLFPEGIDLEPTPIEPTDIPVVDSALSLTSDRPVQNQAIARAITGLGADIKYVRDSGSERIATIEGKITAEANRRSEDVLRLENDIAVERARINSLASLEDGSTTGDAELADIRVGADGKTYTNAGEAVRGQIGDLKSDLSKLDGVFDKKRLSTNLFDNNFDEIGYIDSATGQDVSGSSYKRTSNYYEIDNADSVNINIRLSSTIAPFKLAFYDEAKNYLSTSGADNTTIQQRTLPTGAKYFRVWTDASYDLECYIGTVYVETIVPYTEGYCFKNNSINGRYLADDIKNNSNLIDSVVDNKYLETSTGKIYDNENYRATDFVAVEEGTVYRLGLFNDANAPSTEINAITVCFYDLSKTFISGESVYSSGGTIDNGTWEGGMIEFRTPSGAVYAKVGANDSAYPFKWYLAKSSDSELYTAKDSIKVNAENFNTGLQGKVIAYFGDSIVGNTRDYTSTPFYVSKACGATVYNFGFGGCRMSVHSGDWDRCSMYRLADNIYNDDFSDLETAINTGWSGMPGYFRNTVAWLNTCDFSKVDAIIISYGTNDYREGTSMLDNANNKYDTTTVCGALRYAIKQIQSRHPHIQILVTSPVFRTFFVDGTTDVESYSDTKDWGSGTLKQYAEAYKTACEDMKVHFLDLYNVSGLNEFTRTYFYPSDDGTHPNEYGRERIGTLIGGKLKSIN